MDMVSSAQKLAGFGLSVIPIVAAKKTARVPWTEYMHRTPTLEEVAAMFTAADWLAVPCGEGSGNFEAIDFDKAELYPQWCQLLDEHGHGELLERLLVQRTPSGGCHVMYRCSAGIEGNQKLAMCEGGEVGIETRGQGGYILCHPTPGYTMVHGRFTSIPDLTAAERDVLLSFARFFDETPLEQEKTWRGTPTAKKPGDEFNRTSSWNDVLEPYGWRQVGKSGKRLTWVRPGKEAKDGISATTGNGPDDLLWVHSTNAAPLEAGRSYDKFGAFVKLKYNGDFHMAAKDLVSATKQTNYVTTEGVVTPEDLAPLKLDEFSATDFDPVILAFLWDPYLPKGKCILFDADGGTGKSSFAIALAAGLSQGFLPCGAGTCAPVKTLYLHKGEDQSDELETVYRACGGKPGMIKYFSGDLVFDAKGCQMLEQTIKSGGFGLVVVDAFFYFLLGVIKDTSVMLEALPVMQRLNAVAARTGAVILNIRHTTKGVLDKRASDLGMGSVQFRNSHRGQLVAQWSKSDKGLVIVTDEKGSILVPRGEPFAYRRSGLAIEYVAEFEHEGDMHKSPPKKLKDATEAICRYFAGAKMALAEDITTHLRDRGFSSGTISNAMKALGIVSSKEGFTDRKYRWLWPDDAYNPHGDS